MLTWESCISYRRYGYKSSDNTNHRSDFTRDYDRIIFSSSFRRLQNKTQVFPLPGNVFVHNRLTHSLEVASVGRSIGTNVGQYLCQSPSHKNNQAFQDFYKYELSGVISSACLAHDLGNPAFGHSGEKAISHFFTSHKDTNINGLSLQALFSNKEWHDVTNFEGNANAFRLLTHTFKGKVAGGMRLMFITLASIIKYPCASDEIDKSLFHRKKYGYFQSNHKAFIDVVDEFSLLSDDNKIIRHPFVYLVEAADDICYRIIDMEDAHRIGLLSKMEIEYYFLGLLKELNNIKDYERILEILQRINDDNEAIAYLRTKCIGNLIEAVTEAFKLNESNILSGIFNSTLITEVEKQCPFLKQIEKISIDKIYNHHSVIEVELAGYNVMSEILSIFVEAVLSNNRSPIQKKTIFLIPNQFNLSDESVSPYEKIMGILDFVSGMTDGYATELYRKIKGIEIPSHK